MLLVAVLLALKSLQDKIRQLECDRSNAEKNLKTLTKETAKAREASKALGRDRSPRWRQPVVVLDSEIDKENKGLYVLGHTGNK